MRFIRVRGRVVPVREKSAEQFGDQAGRLLSRVKNYSKKAKELRETQSRLVASKNVGLQARAAVLGNKAKHFEVRAFQASTFGKRAGELSNQRGLITGGKAIRNILSDTLNVTIRGAKYVGRGNAVTGALAIGGAVVAAKGINHQIQAFNKKKRRYG